MRRLFLAALLVSGCGYVLSARPPLPGGVERLVVPVLENDGSDVEVGAIVASRLAVRAERDDRLAPASADAARLVGRVDSLSVAPVAFPPRVSGAGLYSVALRVTLRLVPASGGAALTQVVVSGTEPFLAGRDPEETEANRRRAIDRLAERLADDAWLQLTSG